MVKSLNDGKEFQIQASKAKADDGRPKFLSKKTWGGDRYEELSLLEAFQYWLVKSDDVFYKHEVNYVDILNIYINRKLRIKI